MSVQMRWLSSDGVVFSTEDAGLAHVQNNVGVVVWEIFVDSAAVSQVPPAVPVQNNAGATTLINGETNEALTLLGEASIMVPSGGSIVVTHASDGDNKREVTAWYEENTTFEDEAWESDQESDYIFEDDTKTVILKGFIQLKAQAGFGPTTTNFALSSTAFSSDPGSTASNGNDDSTSSIWYNSSNAGATDRWWAIDAGFVVPCSSGTILWYSNSYVSDFRVQGSDDGVTWTTHGTFTGTYGSGVQTWSLSQTEYHRYWKFEFFNHGNGSYTVIREGVFFEDAPVAPGYSTTSMYVHNAFTQTLPTVSWGVINSVAVNSSEPADTEIRILASWDGGISWRSHSGSAWVSQTLSDIETAGMTKTAFEALASVDFEDTDGFVPGSGSLDLAVSLSTTNNQRTPQISGFTFDVDSVTFLADGIGTDAVEIRKLSETQTEIRNRFTSSKTFQVRIYR